MMEQTNIHRMLRTKAADYGLSQTQLNAVCQVTAGVPLNRLTVEQARFVLTTIVAKGDATAEWARELERTL